MRQSRGITFTLAAVVAIALTAACAPSRDRGGVEEASDEQSAAGSAESLSADHSMSRAAATGAAGGSSASQFGGFGDSGGDGGGGADTAVLPASVSAPRIVRTATLHVEVGDGAFARAFSEVATIASAAGGFVASSNSAASDGELASGTLTLRVPAERFDEVRTRLRELGTVESEQLHGDDVGGQLTDLEARLRNLRAQEEAMRALMAKATNVQDTLQIQNQLSAVREQIEQIDGQRARLEDAVTFATVTVQLTEPGIAPVGDRSRLAEALDQALSGAASMLAGAIVALGYLVPAAAFALAMLMAYRLARRGRSATVAGPASVEHGA